MNERKPCHNCRRRRLRCDRSVPTCFKCTKTGQKCLGYGQLFRWVDAETAGSQPAQKRGVAVPPHINHASESYKLTQPFVLPLADPLLQDLDGSSRRYMSYFASRFCQDLVVHDSAELGTNPFRQLIPMSQTYPYLQQIIIAVSAVHYYNAVSHATTQTTGYSHLARLVLVDALCARQKAIRGLIGIIQLKQSNNGDGHEESQADQDALLATVLFFVNFTLIDSGKDDWQNHLTAAGRLLSIYGLSTLSLAHVASDNQSSLFPYQVDDIRSSATSAAEETPGVKDQLVVDPPLTACDYVASDTVAYLIWNCALGSLVSTTSPSSTSPSNAARSHDYASQLLTWDVSKVLRILSRTEANSYHSCPAYLMSIVLRTAQITQHIKIHGRRYPDTDEMTEYLQLLKEAETFDVEQWAAGVSTHIVGILGVTDEHELAVRRHISATYRAAVCLYILLVAPGIPAEVRRRQRQRQRMQGDADIAVTASLPGTEDLVSTILQQLSFIPKTSTLFKFTVWPVFLTGVDAVSHAHRTRVGERLSAMRDLCPWGMLTSAIETLKEIWKLRDEAGFRSRDKGESVSAAADTDVEDDITAGLDTDDIDTQRREQERERDDWLSRLQGLKIDCLIV